MTNVLQRQYTVASIFLQSVPHLCEFNLLRILGRTAVLKSSNEIKEGTCDRGRSQWSRRLRRRSAAARWLGLLVRIPLEAWVCVPCVCCVLSVRGLCGGPITHPEEPYRVWHVLTMISEHQPRGGLELPMM